MTKIKLYTASTLTEGQHEEYSALHIIPEGEERDARIEAFRTELSEAGIEALLTTTDEVGPGQLVAPNEVKTFDIFYNYEWEEETIRVYGTRELCRNLHVNFIENGYYMEEAEALTKEDIDHGSPLLFKLIDKALQENDRWIEYDVTEVTEDEACAA